MGRISYTTATVLVLATPGLASAAPETVQGDAGARVISTLTLESWEQLYFGTIMPDQSQVGTVSIDTAGARTCPSILTCVTDDHHAGKFGVLGTPNAQYTISVQSATTITNGSDSMQVTNLTPSQMSGTLVSGYDEFMIGGDLTVPAQQPVGDYTGTFTITVDYQ